MMLIKPKFWDKKIGFFAIVLLPFSLIYLLIFFLKKKITNSKTLNIPIVCIGNIYIGGTGKTPTSIHLAKEISSTGIKTAIVRKYYQAHKDEHDLIKENYNDLILNQNRFEGVIKAEKMGYNIAILDDGLQDFSIKKNLNIVCFNQKQLIGNGLVIPSGPLRESLSALTNADILIINGKKNEIFEKKVKKINNKIEIYYSSYEPINLNQFTNKKLLALAAIGNPENFFKLLEDHNLLVKKKITFPDHYIFSKKEIEKIIIEAEKENYQIVMTEKDYFKIKNFNNNLKYLKVALRIENQEKILNRIKALHV